MRALIVGGGIGGLAAALGLLKEGFEPLVLEQAPSLLPVGAGVNLTPNAMKAMVYLGADQHIRDTAVEGAGFLGVDLESGTEIFRHSMLGKAASIYGDRLYSTFRPDLVDALTGSLPAQYVRLGAAVKDIWQTDDSVFVRLESGEEISGDILIGADGLNSVIRAKLFGQQKATFSGYAAWRSLIPAATAPKIPSDTFTRTYMGDSRHIVFFPICKGSIYNFAGFVPATEIKREAWNISSEVSELRDTFAAACDEVQDIMSYIRETFITGIFFRDPLASWTQGRITLLGDAAHPVPPSAAQGATMALEDAVTLAICLRRYGAKNCAAAFADYQRRRIPAATRILIQARSNLRLYNESDPVQRNARTGFYRGLAQIDAIGDVMRGWMYRQDAVKSAERPVEDVERETTGINPLKAPAARAAYEKWRTALTASDNADGWIGQRAGYERFAAKEFSAPKNTKIETIDCGGGPALRVAGNTNGPALLYLHGGGYTMGSAQSAVAIAARLAQAIGGWALIPDYRLAPEYPFPAALDDALAAYSWLVTQTTAPIYVAGDDAGGALSIALAVEAKKSGLRPPAALYAISPFCDLSVSSESARELGPSDPWVKRNTLMLYAARYIQETGAHDPRISPLHADLSGLPPLLIHASAEEALRDDAMNLSEAAKRAGVNVTLRLFDDAVHSFPLFADLPESKEALNAWAAFATNA